MTLYLFNVSGLGFFIVPQSRILYAFSAASDGSQPIFLRVEGVSFLFQLTLVEFNQVMAPVTYPTAINCFQGGTP